MSKRLTQIVHDLEQLADEHGLPNAFHYSEVPIPRSTQYGIGKDATLYGVHRGERFVIHYLDGWWHCEEPPEPTDQERAGDD